MDLLLYHPLKSTPFLHSLPSTSLSRNRPFSTNWSRTALPCVCSSTSSPLEASPKIPSLQNEGRRALMGSFLIAAAAFCLSDVAEAASTSRRALRGAKIPESEYTTLPNGLKYYDLKVGNGAEAVKGSRVAVHYVAKWRNITFMTSRQGMGVGGGTPYGFDVGQSERGTVLKGLDLGVQGMRVGGQAPDALSPHYAQGPGKGRTTSPQGSIVRSLTLHFCKRLFPRLELVTSWSHGINLTTPAHSSSRTSLWEKGGARNSSKCNN